MLKMFDKNTYINRRHHLKKMMSSGIILLLGNRKVPLNYRGNYYPFRQDSHFLYFFGIDMPDFVGIIDIDSGEEYLFKDTPTFDDIIWEGDQPSINEIANLCGIEKVYSSSRLYSFVKQAMQLNRNIHYLPPYRCDNLIYLTELLALSHEEIKEKASSELILTIAQLRSVKEAQEIKEIENALNEITSSIFLNAIQMATEGTQEIAIASMAEGFPLKYGCRLAFPIICTVNGHILHNETYTNVLKKGQLLLLDVGSESKLHYATDITRTIPVDKTFSLKQKDIYQLVLHMQQTAFNYIKPNVSNFSVHIEVCKVLAQGLIDLGLMKGNNEEIVSEGAHALFFPHGIGHLLGLDVHDMEDLGENNVGYDENYKRSTQFGTKFLRYGKLLKENMVITVEPGIYFIPHLFEWWEKEKKFDEFINYEKCREFLDLGGIRIEDDVLITHSGCRVLSNSIPKTIAEIELLKI